MIFRLRLLSEFAAVAAFTLFEPYYVAAQGIPITLCKNDFVDQFPKEMYDVNVREGPNIMNCVEATNNNPEDLNNIFGKVLSDPKCKKVASFVMETVDGVMEADIQGFKQLSNFLLDVPDKWFMEGCKMGAATCIEEVVLPTIESYIENDRDVDGCCVGVMKSQEIEYGKKILHELKDIVDGLVCTKRVKSSKGEQAQTCGYTFLQGMLGKRDSFWSHWVRNLMPMVQIPTDQACSAFWGEKFVNTNGKEVAIMPSSPLRNCADGYDDLFSWISRTFMDLMLFLDEEPTAKNIMEMFHTMLFLDDKCLRVETPLFFLFNNCDNNDSSDSNDSNDNPRVSSGVGSLVIKVAKGLSENSPNFLPVVAPGTLQGSSDDEELLGDILSDMMKMCLTMPTGFSPSCVTKCRDKKGRLTSGGKKFSCRLLTKLENKNDVCKMPVDGHAWALVENFCPKSCNHAVCSPK